MKTIIFWMFVVIASLTFAQENSQDILDNYMKVKASLVKGSADETTQFAKKLKSEIEEGGKFSSKIELMKYTDLVLGGSDIHKKRDAFAKLSVAMWKWANGRKGFSKSIYYQYCPMKKVYWLSYEQRIENPYYGSTMLTCGNVSSKL